MGFLLVRRVYTSRLTQVISEPVESRVAVRKDGDVLRVLADPAYRSMYASRLMEEALGRYMARVHTS